MIGVVVIKVKTMDLAIQLDFIILLVVVVVAVMTGIGHTMLVAQLTQDVELILELVLVVPLGSQDNLPQENLIVCLLEILRMKIAILILS
jgi:hypothetical protein